MRAGNRKVVEKLQGLPTGDWVIEQSASVCGEVAGYSLVIRLLAVLSLRGEFL